MATQSGHSWPATVQPGQSALRRPQQTEQGWQLWIEPPPGQRTRGTEGCSAPPSSGRGRLRGGARRCHAPRPALSASHGCLWQHTRCQHCATRSGLATPHALVPVVQLATGQQSLPCLCSPASCGCLYTTHVSVHMARCHLGLSAQMTACSPNGLLCFALLGQGACTECHTIA